MGYKKSPTHYVPGWNWLGHKADQSPPTYHPGVHMDITFYYDCQLPLTKAVSCNLFFTTSLSQKHTHTEQLSTLIYAGTIWVIHAHPTTNNYCHVTFIYETCGEINTQWSYSCPCAHHKGVWKTGRAAPLTPELNRASQKTPVFTVQDAGWAPQPVCTLWKRGKSLALTRNRTIPW